MRKMLVVCLILLICLLPGCMGQPVYEAAEPTAEFPAETPQITPIPTTAPTPEPTPEPTPTPTPEPETVPGLVVGSGIGAVYSALDRGTQLAIVGEDGEYYQVETGEFTGLIEKQFLRPESEAAPEARTVYARGTVSIYPTVYLCGEPVAEAHFNEALNAIDEFGPYLLVEKDDVQGYILSSETGNAPVYYSGGGSSGGSGGGSSGGADGGDIQLGFSIVQKGGFVPLADNPLGLVWGDGAELYLTLLQPGETVKVLSFDEERCQLYLDGQIGTVPRWAIQLETDEPYEAWDGYAAKSITLYKDYRMLVPARDVNLNTPLNVLNDFGEMMLVELEDELYYAKPNSVSHTVIQYSYSPGGGSGGGSSGGSSGGEWTDPVL